MVQVEVTAVVPPAQFPGESRVTGRVLKVLRNRKNRQLGGSLEFAVLTTVPNAETVYGHLHHLFEDLRQVRLAEITIQEFDRLPLALYFQPIESLSDHCQAEAERAAWVAERAAEKNAEKRAEDERRLNSPLRRLWRFFFG